MPGVITVPFLAKQRFGNALFIYCFARGYAEHMGAELQCPDWIGRKLFVNATEPPITRNLRWTELDSISKLPLGYFMGQTDIALRVFAQHEVYLDYYTRAKAREWLKLKPELEFYTSSPSMPDTAYSAAHVRKGDYTLEPFCNYYCEVSDESYAKAIEQFDIPEPILRVQEGARTPPPELEAVGLGFLPDFLLLRDATHLLRANSSFSVWASWLGNAKTYAPVVEDKVGLQTVPFVFGNHPCTAGRFKNQSDLHLKEK
jgi:hypothetical protein